MCDSDNVLLEELGAEFKRLGGVASYHYADDSTKEWGEGDKAMKSALKIFDEHPEFQWKFRELAKGFLWSLTSYRPIKQDKE